MTLVPAKPERFDCLLANDKIIPLRWGRAFARLGELVCTSSTGYYYRRGANGGDLCVGVAGYWERAAADGGRMREE